MRKIRIIEHISLDGVIQAPGGRNEDGDYPYGGWAVPHHDPAVGEAIVAGHGEAFDLLLGRRTYHIWSGFWPTAPKSPLADAINPATKYIATHGPDSLAFACAQQNRKDEQQDFISKLVFEAHSCSSPSSARPRLLPHRMPHNRMPLWLRWNNI